MSIAAERDPWYASWFGEEYLALYPDRDDREAQGQALTAAGLLRPFAERGAILDLACGTGRHAVALRETGYRVVGLDLSMPLLLQTRKRVERPAPGYVRGDMRALPLASNRFGGVVNFFTSFGYFDDAREDAGVLREVARVLAPGGAFLSDFLNAERVLATLASREEKTIADREISIRRRYDPATQRIEKVIEMREGEDARTFREVVRAYRKEELLELHAAAGFEVTQCYGDFDGAPFDLKRSPRLILLAVKRAAA